MHWHGYTHFTRHCKKKVEEDEEKSKGEKWTQVLKATPSKQNSISKGNGASNGNYTPISGPNQGQGSSTLLLENASKKPLEILSTPSEIPEPTNKDTEQ